MKKLTEYGKQIAVNKDDVRSDLLEMYRTVGRHATLVSFHLAYQQCYRQDVQHVTFYNVRVIDDNGNRSNNQLTDHIDLKKEVVEKYIKLGTQLNCKRFMAVCVPKVYMWHGVERACMELIELDDEVPIVVEPLCLDEWQSEIKRLIHLRVKYNLIEYRKKLDRTRRLRNGLLINLSATPVSA